MSEASVQFAEMVRIEFAQIELTRLEREQMLTNIALAFLNGEITEKQAKEAREGLLP